MDFDIVNGWQVGHITQALEFCTLNRLSRLS